MVKFDANSGYRIPQVSACLNPQRVFNKYVGRYVLVPCRKCTACLASHGLQWSRRLDAERKNHEFCLFGTLTYSDKYLPLAYFDSLDMLGANDSIRRLHHTIDKYSKDYYYNDYEKLFPENDEVFTKNLYKYKGIPCLCHADISMFFRMVKKAFSDEHGYKCEFEYYACGEYGPTGYRPHFHWLIFTDDSTFSRWIENALPYLWSFEAVRTRCIDSKRYSPLGRIDFQPVTSSASSYVSQYLNYTSHLPQILGVEPFRPYHVQSRKKVLGMSAYSEDTLRQLFYTSSASTPVNASSFTSPSYVPLSVELTNTLFPRFESASTFDFYSRCSLVYACIPYLKDFTTKDFVNDNLLSSPNTVFGRLLCRYLGSDISVEQRQTKLTRLLSVVRRYVRLAHRFRCHVSFVVDRVMQYESNAVLLKMSEFYVLQQKLIESGWPYQHMIALYDFTNYRGDIPERYLKRFGLSSTEPKLRFYLDFKKFQTFKDYELLCKKIFLDTTKTRKRNDYLEFKNNQLLTKN